MKVFIADDESIIREGLKHIIPWKELGFQLCGEASNGEDALKRILELNPELVLLDIRMPKLQGTDIVKLAREQNYHGKFIILSGYSDFTYAQTAIKYGVDFYLTKPIDEDELYNAVKTVKDTIRKENISKSSLQHYREKAKYSILRDILLNTGDFTKTNLTDINLSAQIYQVVLYESYHRDMIHSTCNFYELLTATAWAGCSCDYIKIHEKDVILLKDNYALERFHKCLEHYSHIPQKGSPLDALFITYGRPVHSLQEVHTSYEDALQLLNRRFFCEHNQHVIGYQDLPSSEAMVYSLNEEKSDLYCKQLIDYLQSYNRNRIAETLHQLTANLYKANADVPAIKLFLTDIYLQIKHTISHLYSTLDIPFATNSRIIDFIESKYYLFEIMLFFSEQFEMIMNTIGNPSSDSVLENILYYINHNFKENIKLETIAPIFGYNSSYLGKLFTQKTGESFNSYIDHMRINHSKKLLLENNRKVYEIAEEIGYKNVDYFHKKFKKYVGESPAEFRKKMGQEERVAL